MLKHTKRFKVKKDWIGRGITVVVNNTFEYNHDIAVALFAGNLAESKSWQEIGTHSFMYNGTITSFPISVQPIVIGGSRKH